VNWIGGSLRSHVAALIGSLVGFLLYQKLFAMGFELPWLIGLLTGLAAALVSVDKSLMRNLLVGTVAVWVAACAQVVARHELDTIGLLTGLTRFHETLNLHRFALHAAGALIAVLVGGASWSWGLRPPDTPPDSAHGAPHLGRSKSPR